VSGTVIPEFLYLPLLLCVILSLIITTFFKNDTPAIRGIIWVSLAFLGLRYETWRFTQTLNLDTPLLALLSMTIFAAEIVLYVHFLVCSALEIWRKDRTAESERVQERYQRSKYTPSVDVYITTYNEPLDIVRATILGCQAMDYDNFNVYVLDDGNRPEMKALANECACLYIARNNNKHYKAGNLNNALTLTDGELIACFDADFIPTRNFLKRTVGYFQETDVAIVQTPQNFYNSDPIENNLGLFGVITNEQELFFKKVQTARDAANAVICCGTSYVIRRNALNEMRGFPTVSITEDFLTSIELHAKGYRVVYLNELLSAGDAPGNIGIYINQRIRWCRGILQTLFSTANPLFKVGLDLKQRIYHSLGIFYWFTVFARIVLLLTPLLYLIFAVYPVRATVEEVLYFFFPYYLTYLFLENWMNGGKRSPIWSDLYEIVVAFPILLTIIATLSKPFGTAFYVSPKMQSTRNISLNTAAAYPLFMVFLLYCLGFMIQYKNWAWQYDHGSTVVNIVWGLYNLVLIWLALQICFDVPQNRSEVVFNTEQPGTLNWIDHQTGEPKLMPVLASEISLIGATLEVPEMPPGSQGTLDIPGLGLSGFPILLIASESPTPPFIRIHYHGLSIAQQRQLVDALFCEPGQWQELTVKENNFWWNFIQSIFRLYPLIKTANRKIPV
jgi:cellulose synthase (UDP-forming)